MSYMLASDRNRHSPRVTSVANSQRKLTNVRIKYENSPGIWFMRVFIKANEVLTVLCVNL